MQILPVDCHCIHLWIFFLSDLYAYVHAPFLKFAYPFLTVSLAVHYTLTLGTTVTKAALQWRGRPVIHNLIFMWTHPWVPPGENGSPPRSRRHSAHLTFTGKRLNVSSFQKHATHGIFNKKVNILWV